MQIELNLDRHCVETEIRHLYGKNVRSCLKKRRVTDQDEAVIELLKNLLETVDFSRLRSSMEEVLNGEKLPVVLVVDGNNTPWIEIENQRIGMDGR